MAQYFRWMAATALMLLAPASQAAFHLMKIVEVFPGTPAAPNAQYVVLQMYAGSQNFVGGHSVIVFNAADTEIHRRTFAGNVANGVNQDKIYIATADAIAFFGINADLTMSPMLPQAGGKVCFDSIDCMAWGNYSGPPGAGDAGITTPFNRPDQPGTIGTGGLPPGRATIRSLGGDGILQNGDDTNNSSVDFFAGTPAPRNNARQNGVIPASSCGNGTIEGLEICDDSNTSDGDACAADCLSVPVPVFADGFE